MQLIYADFNKSFTRHSVALTTMGTREDLEKYGLEPREGLVVYLYDYDENEAGEPDDVWVKGVVHWNKERGHWEATIVPDDIRHVSTSAAEWDLREQSCNLT